MKERKVHHQNSTKVFLHTGNEKNHNQDSAERDTYWKLGKTLQSGELFSHAERCSTLQRQSGAFWNSTQLQKNMSKKNSQTKKYSNFFFTFLKMKHFSDKNQLNRRAFYHGTDHLSPSPSAEHHLLLGCSRVGGGFHGNRREADVSDKW